MYTIDALEGYIPLGNQRDFGHTIQIDLTAWADFNADDWKITYTRPGESATYPVPDGDVSVADNVLTWTISEVVTAINGAGSVVIEAYRGGEMLKHSDRIMTIIGEGHEPAGEAPDPVADWIEDATQKLSEVDHFVDETIEATENANTATGLANNATLAANNAAELANTKAGLANDAAALANTKAGEANSAATSANNAADRANTIAATMEGIAPLWTDAEISVTPLEPYETPTAAITQDENGTHFNFGIPDGRTYFATFEINYETGMLEMTTPDGYDGPVFTYNEETGMLEVTI